MVFQSAQPGRSSMGDFVASIPLAEIAPPNPGEVWYPKPRKLGRAKARAVLDVADGRVVYNVLNEEEPVSIALISWRVWVMKHRCSLFLGS